MRGLAFLLVMTGWSVALAQAPQASFSVSATACRGENIMPVNNSTNATAYEWDVCQGDLALLPTGMVAGTLIGGSTTTGVDVVFDGTSWYAFVTSVGNNTIFRVAMGSDLSSFVVDGTFPLSGNPTDISIVNDNGNWYGFVHNEGSKEIVRLDFGTALTGTPTATVVASFASAVGNQGIDVIRTATAWFIVQSDNSNIRTLRLATITSIPTGGDIVTTNLANPSQLKDVKILESNGNYFVYVATMGANLYRLSYGSNLNGAPTIGDLSSILPSGVQYHGIDGGFDNGIFYLFHSTLEGSIVRVNLGPDLAQAPVQASVLGALGVFTNNVKSRLVKHGSSWFHFALDYSSARLLKASFPSPSCELGASTLTDESPILTYSSAGAKNISLRARNGGRSNDAHGVVTVSSLVSPSIDFDYQNFCATFPTNFSVSSAEAPTSVLWDFGDGTNDNQPAPSKTYALADQYVVSIIGQFANSCFNSARNEVSIYNKPTPAFIIPPAAPYCTNHTYALTNTSTSDPGSLPGWEWQVNGFAVSTQQNLDAVFVSPTAQSIKLIASIPGCSAETTQNIPSVTTGPLITFTGNDDCLGNTVQFSNNSTGVDNGYVWDFGDGTPTSSLPQPSHDYATIGEYTVTLSGSNSGGCTNFMTTNLTLYSVPQPDFSVGLPPFSCSNSPTLFQNSTPALTDSNISNWDWEFGDPANSTASLRDPSFTYSTGGSYSVSLTATSDAGCSQTTTKLVTIGTSPVADFVNGPACINQGTQFSDISTGGVQSRNWQIGGSIFTSANPTYTFLSSGSHNVTLTVTATGGCNDVITKPVVVPVLPTLSLEVDNPCAEQPMTFTLVDGTSPPFIDPVVGWQWNIAGSATTGNPATGTITLPGLSPVSVTTTHASGCVYMQTNQINIYPSPVADFTATPDRGDAPLTVQFQNESVGATQNQWIFLGSPSGFSNDPSPVHTFLTHGDFSAELIVVNADGCSDTKTIPIQVLVPTVDLVLTEFTLSPDGLTGKLKPTVTVRNNSNIPLSAIEIAIHLSDLATVTESIVVNLGVGATVTKTLTLTVDPNQFPAAFVCAEVMSEKDVVMGDNRQCITFGDADFVFDPYPNPITGLLYMDWVSQGVGTASITIYNSQGRREYEWQTPSLAGLNQSIHDLSFLAPGVYFVTVQTSTNIQTRRFVRL